MWCKLLSRDSSMPMVMVYGGDKAEFVGSTSWVQALVHEGDFAVRRLCCKVASCSRRKAAAACTRQEAAEFVQVFCCTVRGFHWTASSATKYGEFPAAFPVRITGLGIKANLGHGSCRMRSIIWRHSHGTEFGRDEGFD